jgi:hypothetical protein
MYFGWLYKFADTGTVWNQTIKVIADLDPNTTIVIPFTTNIQALIYLNTLRETSSPENGFLCRFNPPSQHMNQGVIKGLSFINTLFNLMASLYLPEKESFSAFR